MIKMINNNSFNAIQYRNLSFKSKDKENILDENGLVSVDPQKLVPVPLDWGDEFAPNQDANATVNTSNKPNKAKQLWENIIKQVKV